MKVEGRSEDTKLRHAMRQMRGAYMENVRKGRCPLDTKVLSDFDQMLEKIDAEALPAKRK